MARWLSPTQQKQKPFLAFHLPRGDGGNCQQVKCESGPEERERSNVDHALYMSMQVEEGEQNCHSYNSVSTCLYFRLIFSRLSFMAAVTISFSGVHASGTR